MTSGTNDFFYSRLPVNQIPLSDLLTEEHLFFTVPPNWHVLITDVKKSTEAVSNGLHETVNLVATGSIVAVLNIALKENLTVPYFFGGDGATFIIPPAILNKVMVALCIHQKNTAENYNILLRVGHVSVESIYANGHQLNISKLKSADQFSIPILLGGGLSFAEKIIKGEDYDIPIPSLKNEVLDLSGMQCRWDKVKPPQNLDEVVSLVVIGCEGIKQAEVFKKVIDKIDEIYGQPQTRTPISTTRLKLKATIKKISDEMKVKMGGSRPLLILKTWITTLLGTLYFKTKSGKDYLVQLVDFSDTLVIDGKINTVISGTTKQRELLEIALNELEQNNEIHYGLFVSKESVMSCYVRSMDKNHVHFIDGSDGGYTKAATILKSKLATDKS
ncbi:MAG: DUF3095 domain-containing protein [Chitinophagaceae bacterium]|nr:DUF3095 domain-containing protein [Chitinophagaceae bacterium]MBP9104356.1 DUF3095 domain-containing protein [Chitinophagaceae bacterium]